jgi:hypothetical protein
MNEGWTAILAATGPGALSSLGDGGWLRAAGGTILVLVLLVFSLRLLRRWPGVRRSDSARVEAVWPLGFRREIHVVRLEDEVHYVYRNEQGLVLLRREPWADYRGTRLRNADAASGRGRSGLLKAVWRRLSGAWTAPADTPRTPIDPT